MQVTCGPSARGALLLSQSRLAGSRLTGPCSRTTSLHRAWKLLDRPLGLGGMKGVISEMSAVFFSASCFALRSEKRRVFCVWLTSEENEALWNSVNSLLQQISTPGRLSASPVSKNRQPETQQPCPAPARGSGLGTPAWPSVLLRIQHGAPCHRV